MHTRRLVPESVKGLSRFHGLRTAEEQPTRLLQQSEVVGDVVGQLVEHVGVDLRDGVAAV